jgi:hypothetical protein
MMTLSIMHFLDLLPFQLIALTLDLVPKVHPPAALGDPE